jgi:hypothetical protein
MSSFEFTPGGVKELGAEASNATATINAGDAIRAMKDQVAQQEAARAVPAGKTVKLTYDISALPAKPVTPPLKRRHFVKELRARLAVVERQIKNLRELEDEAAEIKRLIAAAKAPAAKVTPITTARSAG